MQEIYDDWDKKEKLKLKKINKIFNQLKKRLPASWLQQIKYFHDDCGVTNNHKITDKPINGIKQIERSLRFRHIFISLSQGYVEDSYYGEMSIPIKNGQYLTFSFSD